MLRVLMCGRFSIYHSLEKVCERFGALSEGVEWKPRYNIAPTQEVLTVVSEKIGERRVRHMVWGLVPNWSKDRKIGPRLINARSETLNEKPSFRESYQRRRCLIPADGFYEWQGKHPFYIRMKGKELFSFAGLWDTWVDETIQQPLNTVTIVTTRSNALLKGLHERMPVIISRQDENVWLDVKTSSKALKALYSPYPNEQMEYYPVSTFVSSWKNEGEDCIQPLVT